MRLNSMSALTVVTLCVLGTCAASAQTVIFVDADATGAGNGTSWADAYTAVQPALNTAQPGDQVWVAAGRYVENITLALGVVLYGGFAGTEDPATFDLATRDFVVNETILDGNQSGSVVTGPPGATETTRIDGFTITNGSGTEVISSKRFGGGLFLHNSSPTIANNTIRGNYTFGGGGGGGGLYLYNSSAVITDNTISYNQPGGGGGGLYVLNSSAVITNNLILDNVVRGTGAWGGGGLYLGDSTAVVANNIIASNAAYTGTAVHLWSGAPILANNTITGNVAPGGAANAAGIYLSETSATIVNTIVAFNSSGVLQEDCAPTLRHNCIYGNAAYDYAGLADPTGTDGNISVDPLLAGLKYGNRHIEANSPCVDAGDNTYTFGDHDMDGEPRIRGVGGIVDIGADESDGTIWGPGPYVIARVSPTGDDDNDGSSWALAKRTVQAGVDAAAALGGEVWVAAGTYYGLVTLHPYTHVFGGFTGSETQFSERNWRVNATILDGEQLGAVVTARAGHGVSTIDGFTITNGVSDGGVALAYASPTITNNSITGNSAWRGGGLCLLTSAAIIKNNTITVNTAVIMGGGLWMHTCSPTISNNS